WMPSARRRPCTRRTTPGAVRTRASTSIRTTGTRAASTTGSPRPWPGCASTSARCDAVLPRRAPYYPGETGTTSSEDAGARGRAGGAPDGVGRPLGGPRRGDRQGVLTRARQRGDRRPRPGDHRPERATVLRDLQRALQLGAEVERGRFEVVLQRLAQRCRVAGAQGLHQTVVVGRADVGAGASAELVEPPVHRRG